MRKFRLLFLLFALSASACAGGSSRYGCPAKPGHSCKSVSEVYAETTSGAEDTSDPLRKPRGSKKSVRAKKKLLKGVGFRTDKDTRRDGDTARAEGSMPVYIPPLTIRLWIAPWQDAQGVFHSEKYVYVLTGRGRWTIGGKTVPLGETEEGYPGNIRLRGTGRAP